MIAPIRPRRHILTIALEDYFQVGAFNRFVQKNQWYRFETRLEQNTDRTLDLLKRHDATATFFVLGWVAQKFPELVRRVTEAGHEVAIKGFYHRSIRDMAPEEFEVDCLRAKEAVETASGRKVVGYRLADGWFGPEDLWALDVLAKLGFGYDSSIAPIRGAFANQPFRRTLHEHFAGEHSIWEVPISTAPIFGVRLPVAGGNYLRQLPKFLTRRACNKWDRRENSPLVAYFHVWELDPEQPRLSIGGWRTRMRHYRNLARMEGRLTELFTRYPFTSAASYLQLPLDLDPNRPRISTGWSSESNAERHQDVTATPPPEQMARLTPVSIVVPCFNEEESISYLANTLRRVREHLRASGYDARFQLIDDCSTDRTWDGLNAAFENQRGFEVHRHDRNLGVAAAILTGIKYAGTEIVCSMDCDCTYDPLELANMIPLLKPGVDLVTASPYHPKGKVRNVPRWRLGLSKGAAWLYRRVLKHKLHTFTSCFRVYRRSSVAGLQIANGRYLGIAELLGKLDLAGGTIVEYPATLEVRMLGRSKMKTVRTIIGHLGLMAKLARRRWLSFNRTPNRDTVIRSVITSHSKSDSHAIQTPRPVPQQAAELDVRKVVLHGTTHSDDHE